MRFLLLLSRLLRLPSPVLRPWANDVSVRLGRRRERRVVGTDRPLDAQRRDHAWWRQGPGIALLIGGAVALIGALLIVLPPSTAAALITALQIAMLRVTDVMLGVFRTTFIIRGRTLAASLAAFGESAAWISAAGIVLADLTIVRGLAFATGVGIGTALGVVIVRGLRLGLVTVRCSHRSSADRRSRSCCAPPARERHCSPARDATDPSRWSCRSCVGGRRTRSAVPWSTTPCCTCPWMRAWVPRHAGRPERYELPGHEPPRCEEDPMRSIASRTVAAVAWTVPVLVVVQAAMIGQTLYGSSSLMGLHGSVGNLTFLLAVCTLVMTWPARRSGTALLLTFSSVLLLFVQTGTGYLGHRYGFSLASSVHIGLGVAIAALSATAAMRLSSEQSALRRAVVPDR